MSCPYNKHVCCDETPGKICKSCGHNPEEQKRRVAIIRKNLWEKYKFRQIRFK